MRRTTALTIGFLVASCGDDDGGLGPDTELGALDGEDATLLCEDLIDTYQQKVDQESACTMVVLLGSLWNQESLTAAECRQEVTGCVLVGGVLGAAACEAVLGNVQESCEATVEDWQHCTDYVTDVIASGVEGVTCDLAEDPSALENLESQIDVGIPPIGCLSLFQCDVDWEPLLGL